MPHPRIFPTALLLLAAVSHSAFSQSSPGNNESPLRQQALEGREITIDDEWFDGCFHDAFEGFIREEGEKIERGEQAVSHTKGALTGAGTGHSRFTLRFELDAAAKGPDGPVELILRGIDDSPQPRNRLAVTVNGRKIAEALEFPNNRAQELGLNDRYQSGWKEERLIIPANVLKGGSNQIDVENTTSCFDSQEWNYAFVDWLRLKFAEPVRLTVHSTLPTPVLYYGLLHGPETNAWPAVNLDNRICLLQNTPLQTSFFVTLPREKTDADPRKAKAPSDAELHLETDADFAVLSTDGSEIVPTAANGRRHYSVPLKRLAKYETPHPGQSVALFLRGGAPFEGKELKAWFSVGGKVGQQRTYPIRNVAMEPLTGRDSLKFDLGIWGGQIPSGDPARHEYIAAARNAGFNQMFTGEKQELNTALKGEGMKVFPRFGWFGHRFKVTEELKPFAAIDAKGAPMPADFCPLAILENQDKPEIGKFFARARETASQKDIDGICVDYETAPVWCYCERCLEKFGQETGGKAPKRGEVIPGGPLEHAYLQFGRRRNRDLLARVSEIAREQNNKLQYHALASASDLPCYWTDGRLQARHSVRELATFADAVYASCYFYETAGGMKSVLPIIETVRNYARESGRDVGTYVMAPVATTISEFPRYRGAWMKPDYVRLLIENSAFGGAAGVLLFRGDCFDGETFLAAREAMAGLVAARPWLESGIDLSHEVQIEPVDPPRREFHTEISNHLLARLVWRPSLEYQYDVVQRSRDDLGRDRLTALFNYSPQPLRFRIKVRGLFDPAWGVSDFRSGKAITAATRHELETGKIEIEVPARSSRLIRLLTSTPEAKP